MNKLRRISALLAIAIATSCSEVVAGMPSLTLADVRRELSLSHLTRMRLETISFFLLCLVVCALVIRLIWNGLRKDFPILPRLSVAKAFGLVTIWGSLFVLVLTMISGARELMTPGAWEKKGLTYQLVEDVASPVEKQISERYAAFERLRGSLKQYAREHGGQLPAADALSVLPEADRIAPGSGGQSYVYRGGKFEEESFGIGGLLMAYEPDAFGTDRLVLLCDGSIVWMPIAEIEKVGR